MWWRQLTSKLSKRRPWKWEKTNCIESLGLKYGG